MNSPLLVFARLQRLLRVENLTVSVLSGLIGGVLGLLELIVIVRFLTTDYSALVILLLSIPKIIGFLDFGISPFILNFLSQPNFTLRVKNAIFKISILISAIIGSVVLLFAILFREDLALRLLDNFHSTISRHYLATLLLVSLVLSFLQLIGNIGVAGLWATNKGNTVSYISILSDSISFGILFYYLQNSLNPSPMVIVTILIGISSLYKIFFILMLIRNFHFEIQSAKFNRNLSESARFIPNWRKYGSAFAFTSIAVPLAFQLDNWVVLHYVGSAAVIKLTLYWRLYSYIPLLVDTFSKPFWVQLANLRLQKSDFEDCFNLLFKTVLQISITLSVLILSLLPLAMRSFFDKVERYDIGLSMLCATFAIVVSLDGVYSIALNSLSKMRQIIISSSFMWISNLTITLVATAKLGVYGPMVGSVLAVTISGIFLNQRFLASAISRL